MAIDQQPISRKVTLPTTQVSSGSGFNSLGSAASGLAQVLTERINDVAIQKAAVQGENDVEQGSQPEKLALPFTRATRAYNDAVSNTEARKMVISAKGLIDESLANNTNPATFNRETPAKFNAELEGIKSGTLEHTRPENRARVSEELDRMTSSASTSMLRHSIQYDNQRTHLEMKQSVTDLLEARRNAAIAGDIEQVKQIDGAIDATVSDYSTMNEQIKQVAPYLMKDIQKHKEIDSQMAQFTQAVTDGTSAKFMADLAENKQNLPFSVWQDSVKAVVQLDQEHKRLKNDMNAIQVAQVNSGIANGSIQDASDLLNYDLTVPQQLTAMHQLDVTQAKAMKEGSQLITAQQNILSGRASWNSADTRNKMLQGAIERMQQQTGQIPTLQDMEASLLGKNAYPASGMPDTPIGTNVPYFDSVMQGKLTGGDVMATAQAAMVYNDMVNVQGKPNSVNLTGDALAVATLFNTLNMGGTTPEQAAEQAINTVLHASDPQIQARAAQYHRTYEKIDPSTGKNLVQRKFKEAFGQDSRTFGAHEALTFFTNTFRSNYLSSNFEQAAFEATKHAMRSWGTSKWFDKGYVGNAVPENELPITKIGNAFGNQLASNIQGYINRTNAARDAHPELNIPLVEWANPKNTITGNESDQDKVFKNLMGSKLPRIKIDGHETDVVLIPSATSRLSNRVNYVLGVYDRFNNMHPLKDITNGTDGVARFMPQELAVWAPSVAEDQNNQKIRDVALQIRQQEKQIKVNELQSKTPAWQVILGLASSSDYLEHIANTESQDQSRLNEIFDSLKGTGSRTTRDEIMDADNIGISQDLEPRK